MARQKRYASMEEVLRQAVRARLAETGQSINSLAREAGVDPAFLSRFLRQERTMTLPVADRLARRLALELRKRGE